MSELLYLDTARLGRMSPGAAAAHRDFVALAGDEGGGLYFDRFLFGGLESCPGLGRSFQEENGPRPPTTPADPPPTAERLTEQLRELRLPAFRDHFPSQAERAAQENLSYPQYLEALTSLECEARMQGRIRRMAMASRLPSGKTWDQFHWSRLPKTAQQQFQSLRDGTFLARRENVLLFGKPGSGKTHAICAVAEQLVLRGHPVLFATCSLLVQELLAAKRDFKLERFLKKLAGFSALVIDDLGYVQQSREEMEVLFTLLAERYERGSVMLTSNLPFSQWTAIFKDPMTTAAAIDRLVHHSVIVELNVPSYRLETAKGAKKPLDSSDGEPVMTT